MAPDSGGAIESRRDPALLGKAGPSHAGVEREGAVRLTVR